ncbi:MAG: metal-dependent transcriptional regulator [Clostridia bacterium]|jgi:Mn-dependent DtxR family transcriptional regulator|nr:metal-dependent transcriptional regulator [Clostridia bacterium]
MDKRSLGKSSEDYLEAMLMLKEEKGYIRSVDIADQLGVSKPSVSIAVKKLKESGYLDMDRSGFITLSEPGREIAERIYIRHKTLTSFFQMLGVDPEIAQEDACLVEHDLSEETFNALLKHASEIVDQKK